jgi:DNA-binding XRE family transcriptional regulator
MCYGLREPLMSAIPKVLRFASGLSAPKESIVNIQTRVNIKRIITTYSKRSDTPFLIRAFVTHDVGVSTLRQRFGERVRDIRLEKRLTQDEFAEFLGVSSDFVSSIERGINAPSFERLELMASKLETSVSGLFDFSEEPGTRKRVKLPRRRTSNAGTKEKGR